MNAPINAAQLRYELDVRGVSPLDLARKAGLSPATLSNALADRPISADSKSRIAKALLAIPENEILKRLVRPVGPDIEEQAGRSLAVERGPEELGCICPLGAQCGLRGVRARIIAS
jgi:lambda repressor-like predicted transcriptional regulator